MKPFLTNVRHILKAGVSPPVWPTRCAALWSLVTGLDISVPPSCWSLWSLTVKLTTSTCRGVEMQAGGTSGGRKVGGRRVELHWWAEPTKPQPPRTEMPPSRGEDRFEGKCTTEPVAHLWFVGQLRALARIFCQIFLVFISSKPFAIVKYILQISFPVNLQRLFVWWYEVIAQKKLMWGRGSLGRTLIPTQWREEGAVLGRTISLS